MDLLLGKSLGRMSRSHVHGVPNNVPHVYKGPEKGKFPYTSLKFLVHGEAV